MISKHAASVLESIYIHEQYVCVCQFFSLFIDYHLFPTEASISSVSSLTDLDSVNIIPDDKSQQGIWFISYQHCPHDFPLFLIFQMCLVRR